MSKVYFTKEITSESLVKIYEKLSKEKNLVGKIGVKISTGEKGGNNYVHPEFIKDLVDKISGTIVECNTAYGGSRQDPKDHWKTIEEHGFTKYFNVDIMDEEGEFSIPTREGSIHLKEDIVGDHLKNYDSILMLSHFKGHAMGGFGGALKNMSIGVASTNGKLNIQSAGRSLNQEEVWSHLPAQDDFLESMAEACSAVVDYMKGNIIYINVANRLSVDCDCDSNPDEPEMGDIGIFASVDPVALDQACYDAVKNSSDPGKAALIERMDSRHAIRTVEHANELGLGSREYEIEEI
jgi:uncharacterized Fe-S center protein